ncbi:MAG: DNA polymerase III subunit gamma/tau, partial [Gallicola sp.]|nr:DNA polymerase III subunit gamma/tau [Gallicola sp.]
MAKKAIYREYRPKTFDDVYGQTHITEILKSQVQSGNIAHAYLFSGTRGTGKTSCAKIFARAINCLNLQKGSPCNECANCKMSLNEETMDIVEMDAASNRRIDDIRQLRDVVVYPPANLKYRVYIIDEAHMITNEGFNALLKIMEEPPKHLVFILATTELEKIPATILSRCQRYEFRRIEITDIKNNIYQILEDLSIKIQDNAADLIALKADGSMRDALSSLDQVLSISKDEYTLQDVENVLGVAEQDDLIKILECLSERDYSKTLNSFEYAADGKGVQSTFEELIDYLQSLMMVQVKMESYLDISGEEAEKLKKLIDSWPLDKIMTTIDVLVHYNNLLKNSEQPHVIVQLALYKACTLEMEESLMDQIQTLKRKLQDIEEGGFIQKPLEKKEILSERKENT